jgi:formylmethanofuran dehydrogenase subunit C
VKPFTFTLRQEPPQRVDLSALTPDRLAGKSVAEIEKIEIGTTRASIKAGDVFRIAEGDLKNVRYEGGSARFDLIGAKLLPSFSIHVEGDVGAQLGRLAKSGRITVSGSAGVYAAS